MSIMDIIKSRFLKDFCAQAIVDVIDGNKHFGNLKLSV
jgi:hypothetical protein